MSRALAETKLRGGVTNALSMVLKNECLVTSEKLLTGGEKWPVLKSGAGPGTRRRWHAYAGAAPFRIPPRNEGGASVYLPWHADSRQIAEAGGEAGPQAGEVVASYSSGSDPTEDTSFPNRLIRADRQIALSQYWRKRRWRSQAWRRVRVISTSTSTGGKRQFAKLTIL